MKFRLNTCTILLALACIMAATAAFCQDVWPTFHRNDARTGLAVKDAITGTGVLGTYRPQPIWTFPSPGDAQIVVDNLDVGFTPNGFWTNTPANAVGQYADDYLFVPTDAAGASTADWSFSPTVTAAYFIYIWIPSPGPGEALPHTTDAWYTVNIGTNHYGPYKFDQSTGGAWRILTEQPFLVNKGNNTAVVSLTSSSEAKDADGNPVDSTVIADAVKLQMDAGIVVSSPVVSLANKVVVTCRSENYPFIDTNGPNKSSIGVIYGIGSEVDSNIVPVPFNPVTGLATTDQRGFMKWRYPAVDQDWIGWGITSSPALTTYNGVECAVVPGGDGQVYVVDTNTGALQWKGPGYYVDEMPINSYTGSWSTRAGIGRQDATYKYAAGAKLGSSSATARWTFNLNAGADRWFDVYAWIPPATGGLKFLQDARYKEVGSSDTPTIVLQGSGGFWALVKGNYKVPSGTSQVQWEVTNETDGDITTDSVAVDAMKMVPAGYVGFDFSSPLAIGDIVYIGCTNIFGTEPIGRIYKLQIGSPDPAMYPAADQPAIGGIKASPSLSPDYNMILCGSMDGHVYALDSSMKLIWQYPALGATPLGGITSTAAVTTNAGTHVLYVATGASASEAGAGSEGQIIALSYSDTGASPYWTPVPGVNSGLGAFDQASPLIMEQTFKDGKQKVVLGSTAGILYSLDASAGTITAPTDWTLGLGGSIKSSAAGTYASFATLANKAAGTPRLTPAPMGFVGSGTRIYGIDLGIDLVTGTGGTKDWWWDLMGETWSSPALCNNRIYTGDWEGYTWAFSSGLADGSGAEGWNTELGTFPPTAGSDHGIGGHDSHMKVDVFTKTDWDTLKVLLEKAENSDQLSDWYDASTFAATHMTNRTSTHQLEWGEDFYIVAWNLLDPNRRDLISANWKHSWDLTKLGSKTHLPGWTPNYPGKVEITVKSRAPGAAADSTETFTLAGHQIDNFTDSDKDLGADPAVNSDQNGYAHFYGAYLYTLDGSSPSKSQTPGSQLTISAKEVPQSPDASSDDMLVLQDPVNDKNILDKAMIFAINNPIGIVYNNQYGTGTSSVNIGMTSATVTGRGATDASVNGNGSSLPPVVWGGYTPHNKLSTTRQVQISDRSLLSTVGRNISKFRIERHDLKWTGGPSQTLNFLGWERPPGDAAQNQRNDSEDYPDMDLGQIKTRLQSNGVDPSQANTNLKPGVVPTVTPATTWNVNPTPVNIAVQVPQYQPANVPANLNTAVPTDLQNIGYTSYIYAYVDSSGNGSFNGPKGQGLGNIQQQKISGSGVEAYRVIEVQVHVPADYRAQIEEQQIDIGTVPQGFGFTAGTGGIPRLFQPSLYWDMTTGKLTPPGFAEWFKPFTAKNIGNINLMKVSMLRTNFVSDTVQQPLFDSTGVQLPYSGYYILGGTAADPYVVTTLDTTSLLGQTFLTSVPPVAAGGYNARTFHKPRVGDPSGPVLMIPDYPTWAGAPLSQTPALPALSVAVPLGMPVGTYYGKVQLAERFVILNKPVDVPVSNTVDVVINTTEARLTGGTTLSDPPNPAHLEFQPSSATASGMPAAYRNPLTGNVLLFWSSSRYSDVTLDGATTAPTSTDPWYLYSSKLEQDTTQSGNEWQMSSGAPTQWWRPTASVVSSPIHQSPFPSPTPAMWSNLFPSPTVPDPKRGAIGAIVPGSIKFTSPSIAVDKINNQAYLLFTGQAYKTDPLFDPLKPNGLQRTQESRAYYAEIKDESVSEGDIYSMSPNLIADRIRGDWTTPKFSVRGTVLWPKRDPIPPTAPVDPPAPELWSFWYGGGNGRWRIYYNVKRDPAMPPNPTNADTQWTNEALLPIPKGLSSVAEPSPVANWFTDSSGRKEHTGDQFDVVYSGISTFHKNSDIYMSRYLTNKPKQPTKQGGSIPVTLVLLPQRGTSILEMIDSSVTPSKPIFGEKLTRDASHGTWYSRDVDWLANDASGDTPDFKIYVKLNPSDSSYQKINIGDMIKDSNTGTIAYTYDPNPSDSTILAADKVVLRAAFRAVVINPAEGTVKFMKPPDGKALVVAQYFPRAYRLTTDGVADTSPCTVKDDDPNPRFSINTTEGNPFFIPSGATAGVPPPTDRLWVLWRRPTMDKPGTGIYYKAQRYMVQLGVQMGLTVSKSSSGVQYYTPAVTDIQPALGYAALTAPVEIDWVKNRLYFTCADGVDILPRPISTASRPYPKIVKVTYTDANNQPHVDEPYYVQFADEDMSQPGKTFGNLTSLMVNEGQVSAFKDPLQNRLWVFWTSTRSGNSDIYYETISPRFVGREYK